jgi:hypothetical protein
LNLIDASAKAQSLHRLPFRCGLSSRVITLQNEKETEYQRILMQKLPYAIVNEGFWCQLLVLIRTIGVEGQCELGSEQGD